jgi:HEPN domain-containing protein
MTKQLLELLSTERLKESKLLLDQGCFNGAYYLAGYAIECALKACIAKQINQHEIPNKSFVNEFYVHDLSRLVKLADIEQDFTSKIKTDPDFFVNWNIVRDWNESARYKEWTEKQAKELYNSIESSKGGVLSWIQQYW